MKWEIEKGSFVEIWFGGKVFRFGEDIYAGADTPSQIAEAYLAAAAPELLEACEGLISKLYKVADQYNDRSCDYDVCIEVRKARHAIAKAKGET